jgi:predicted nucleic acid-binding Zn ribbon protein
MPTYVYKFIDTDETIEVQQSFTDDALTEAVHPATGVTMAVKKVFLPVGVTFKGGGFYKTDSRSGSTASNNTASSSTSTSDTSASSGASTTSSESTATTGSSSTPATSSNSGGSGSGSAAPSS